ncbi:MAG: N-methyl-L-tryptophan oxidase [bacterium]|nr:N-methyl-L-tryptophan oxidase [bacterium]
MGSEAFDVVVVGGGVAGAAATEALARRGHRVLLLERFAPGHQKGSSHGDSRIVRYSYPQDIYLEMARLAYAGWADIERACGERLVETTGSWECASADSPHLAELESSFRRVGLPYERWTAAQSRERMPHFDLPEGSEAIYQADGAVARADRAVAALWRLARAAGAVTRTGETVLAIETSANGVELRAASGEMWRAAAVVVTAGAWTGGLFAGLDLALPFEVTQEHVGYYTANGGGPDHRLGRMPTMIDYHTEKPYYSLPQVDVPGVKVGCHRAGPRVDPDRRADADTALFADLRTYVGRRFPHLDPEPIQAMTCLYTNTPDGHFVLDRHPSLPRVVIGAGFSGHGFKFAPVIGQILASLAVGEPSPVALNTFRLARFEQGDLTSVKGA